MLKAGLSPNVREPHPRLQKDVKIQAHTGRTAVAQKIELIIACTQDLTDDLYFAQNTSALRSLLLVLLLLPASLHANNENDPAGARPAGMANAALSFTDIWSLYHNQAGLAYIDGIAAGVF